MKTAIKIVITLIFPIVPLIPLWFIPDDMNTFLNQEIQLNFGNVYFLIIWLFFCVIWGYNSVRWIAKLIRL